MNKREAVKAAISVADDITDGRLSPADLEREAAEAVRELAGRVVGRGDPIWPVQVEITRGVLAAGGIPFGELQEWVGLARHRERGDAPPAVGAEVPGVSVAVDIPSEPRGRGLPIDNGLRPT
jgi:hypothetical protein